MKLKRMYEKSQDAAEGDPIQEYIQRYQEKNNRTKYAIGGTLEQ
jgi:hypothetical protein